MKSLVLLERGSTNAAAIALRATCSGIKIKDSKQKQSCPLFLSSLGARLGRLSLRRHGGHALVTGRLSRRALVRLGSRALVRLGGCTLVRLGRCALVKLGRRRVLGRLGECVPGRLGRRVLSRLGGRALGKRRILSGLGARTLGRLSAHKQGTWKTSC